jgi:VWFA-related protein
VAFPSARIDPRNSNMCQKVGRDSVRKVILFGSIAFFFTTASGASPQEPQSPLSVPTRTQASSAGRSVKVQTRLITVDLVVTDSHGNAVRDLKQDDFRIFDGGVAQKIALFDFVDASANSSAVRANEPGITPSGPHVFSNRGMTQLRVPPTVLLLDGLNTGITNQAEARKHMLLLLETLPANRPVAIFTLGHTVRIVQNFTADSGLLKTAVDHALGPLSVDKNPQDDPKGASNVALGESGGTESSVTQGLEDFEKEQYEARTAVRVDETTDAMVGIARYLGGYPGRKNLIWFSDSFPIWIAPTFEFGGNPALGPSFSTTKIPGQEFGGSGSYTEKIRAAAEALTDAKVAVYPVDTKGLTVPQAYSAGQAPQINRFDNGAYLGSQLIREDNTRSDEQATMDEIAESTGGKTCTNTNDLAGCVQSALNDSSSYYELVYYPENVKWDGHFQKITVKTEQHGVKLAYRRGYFATDPKVPLKRENPAALLQQVCMAPLAATSISLTAEAVPLLQDSDPATESLYLLTISPGALSLALEAGSRQLRLEVAICEFSPKGDTFQIYPKDLSQSVPEDVYQGWQADGIRNTFHFVAKAENLRLRFAVLDVPSGATGSVDVPAHPREFRAASESGTNSP